MSNVAQRTLQVVNAEYYQAAAILGEKVAQIKNLEKEVEHCALNLRNLFQEIGIHKIAAAQVQGIKQAEADPTQGEKS